MMKPLSQRQTTHALTKTLGATLTVALSLSLLVGSTSQAARTKAKTNSASADQAEASEDGTPKPPSKLPGKLPTKLPAYNGPKRITVDFEKDSGEHQTTVVVRTPLPLEKAIDDEKAAAKNYARNNKKKLPPTPSNQVDESFAEMLHDLSPEGAIPDSPKVIEQAEAVKEQLGETKPTTSAARKKNELPAKAVLPPAAPSSQAQKAPVVKDDQKVVIAPSVQQAPEAAPSQSQSPSQSQPAAKSAQSLAASAPTPTPSPETAAPSAAEPATVVPPASSASSIVSLPPKVNPKPAQALPKFRIAPVPAPVLPLAEGSAEGESPSRELMGPPAPPTIPPTAPKSHASDDSPSRLVPLAPLENVPASSEAPAVIQVTRASPPSNAAKPVEREAGWLMQLRGSYLNAKYSELESRLSDGSTALGLGLSHRLPTVAMDAASAILEGRFAVDVMHGIDQSVTPENIRMVLVRGDVLAFVPMSFISGSVQPFASGGLGYASYSVRSVRAVDGNTLTVRRHANGSALALIPAIGARVRLLTEVSLDLQAEYLGLLGGESSSSVGGLAASASLNFKF